MTAGAQMPAGCVDGVLAGRYRLDELIAVGGMGQVWRSQDVLLARTVAVKCLRPEFVGDPEFAERFRAEARHAAGLSHPGIASVYDYGEQTSPEKAAWLVMELVEGEPLSNLLHRNGALGAEQSLDIIGQAAMALEAAHAAGVVHRDVKPGNLLVRPDGVVKVTDFGIARATDAVPITRTGTMVGTAYYLSPEQASGDGVTPASDVYSLGVVAYECLAGRRPFPGDNALAVASAHLRETPPPLPDSVPPGVRELVLRAMEKDPALRPAHAGDLGRAALALRAGLGSDEDGTTVLPVAPPAAAQHLDLPTAANQPDPVAQTRALTQVASPAPVVARPPRRLPPLPPPGRNHRRAVRLASALLAVVVLGLSLRACGTQDEAREPTEQATPSASPSPSVRTVRVVAADYVGKRATEVRAALLGLGLKPTLAYDGREGAAGTVSSVTPSGELAYGSPVTVHVVPQRESDNDEGEGKGKGEGKKDD